MAENRRHIAIYVPSLRGGGAERIMVILANGMAARGHRVDLVLTQAIGPYLPDVADNVRIVDLKRGRVLTSLLPLARYLRRERPDAMLSALNHANIIAILARKLARSRTRLVVSEHNAPSRALCDSAIGWVMRHLIRRFYPLADRVVCVSRAMASEMHDLLGVPQSKLSTIHNPLDIEKVRHRAGAPADHPWLTDHTAPVILAAGRLTRQKDYPTLLDAFARLRKDRDARLIILGQGEEEAKLKALAGKLGIADDVSFAGFRDNPFAFMARCDLYVMSSAWEGFGNVLVEAMACGARVVSTDCPSGPNEILEGGRWGRLVPVGDAGALANAMAAALDDPSPPDVGKRAEAFRSEVAIGEYLDIVSVTT